MVSSDQWQVIFVCFLIDVLNELDDGVWGGPVTNATGEEHIPQALSDIVLVFAISRALPGILKEIMEGNGCGFIFSRLVLEIENETKLRISSLSITKILQMTIMLILSGLYRLQKRSSCSFIL